VSRRKDNIGRNGRSATTPPSHKRKSVGVVGGPVNDSTLALPQRGRWFGRFAGFPSASPPPATIMPTRVKMLRLVENRFMFVSFCNKGKGYGSDPSGSNSQVVIGS
jgi:hypothetical protein